MNFLIPHIQQIYTEAVERKALNWNYLQTLRSERILNGIDQTEALSTSLSNSLWSINNLSGSRLRNSMSSSNESLMSKRGSTPAVKNHHPSITRTTSVGLHAESNNQHMYHSSSRLNGFVDFGSNPSLYAGSSSASQPSLERTSSLGKLSEKPHRGEHNMTMKTISETQLGGMFSDEDFSSDRESSGHSRNPASDAVHEHAASEDLCLIDESLTSDDCSTQSSTDTCTQIGNSEVMNAATTAANKKSVPSSPQRLMEKLTSPPMRNKFGSTKSPNVSPLHQNLQCSLTAENRERQQGPALSPTFLSASNSSSQLKSILRSPSASITSLSSISPTHSISSEHRLSVNTPPMPSTPTSTSADRMHSMLIEGTTMAHSHTILPTGNVDAPKNDKSPSPSPSMDLEVVACKTVIGDGQFCSSDEQQWPRVRSQSDISDNLQRGLQFEVTFVRDANRSPNSDVPSLAKDESKHGLTSPALLHTRYQNPLPIIRQASDSAILSPHQTSGRPHRVMFSECTQIRSFDSESNDSDTDDKIKIVSDDVTIIDLANAEREQSEMVSGGPSSIKANGLPQSHCKYSKFSDKVEPHAPSSLTSQHMAFVSTDDASSVPTRSSRSIVKEEKESIKQSTKGSKSTPVPPAHKRLTGKNVRELSQMFEGTPSPEPVLSPSSTRATPSQQRTRKMSTTKIPVVSEASVDNPKPTKHHSSDSKLTKNHPNDAKAAASRNNLKPSKVSATPPKVASKPAKPSNTAKRKVSTTEKVVPCSDHSPAAVRKAIPVQKNSVCQQRASVMVASKPTTAMRRVSRTEHTPGAAIPRHTSNPEAPTRKQPSANSQSSPKQKLKSSKIQTATSGRDTASPNKKTKSADSNPSRSKLQRQPSVVSSRSPSPYSSGQATHKPLSRLSGTRQPLRRKNPSPAAARRNSQTVKPAADELNSNNSNNNNGNYNSRGDDNSDVSGSCEYTTPAHPAAYSLSQMNWSPQDLYANSLQTNSRLNAADSTVTQCSLAQDSVCQSDNYSSLNGSAVIGDAATFCCKHTQSEKDHQSVKLKCDVHHSLQPLTLKCTKRRDPLEWQNFGLSWKQSSLPYCHSTGGCATISRHS